LLSLFFPSPFALLSVSSPSIVSLCFHSPSALLSLCFLSLSKCIPEIAVTHPPDTFCAVYGRA
jgi:hypothetical protein